MRPDFHEKFWGFIEGHLAQVDVVDCKAPEYE